MLAEGERFTCEAHDPHIALECEVLRTYEVSSRRHYPKVLDVGGSDHDARTATWNAQSAARREYRYRGTLDDAAPLPEYALGLFAAIVAGPLVMPSAWLPEVMGLPDVFETYNEVARLLSEAPDRFIEQTSGILAADASGRVLELWVRGFVHGMAFNDAAWKSALDDDAFRRRFMPIAGVMEMYSSPAKREWLCDRELREKFSLGCAIAAVELTRYSAPNCAVANIFQRSPFHAQSDRADALATGRHGVIAWGEPMLHEIVLPETEPETEWVRGRALQKVSPLRTHARLQLALAKKLDRWAEGRGEVGTEWRFRVAPPGEVRRPLVPDVAYVSNDRLRPLSDEELELPPLAPDVAVEILSPGNRRIDIDDKIETYLRAGSSLVLIVDPRRRVVELHDRFAVALLSENDAIEHSALPGFTYSVGELFGVLKRA